MFQKLAILSGLLISATCTLILQAPQQYPQIPIYPQIPNVQQQLRQYSQLQQYPQVQHYPHTQYPQIPQYPQLQNVPQQLQKYSQLQQSPQQQQYSQQNLYSQQTPNSQHTPNYSFAYSVNDPHTGDIKNQQESRRGDSVTGQYSLLQPDGARRTVDYRADDLRGFRVSVNNERLERQRDNPEDQREIEDQRLEMPERVKIAEQRVINHPSTLPRISSTALPLAVSRTSLVQTIEDQSGQTPQRSNPWE